MASGVRYFAGLIAFATLMPVALSHGQTRGACVVGEAPAIVIGTHGTVTFTSKDGTSGSLGPGDVLCPGDRISTAEASGINLRFDAKDSVTNILSSSTIVIPEPEARADISLSSGLLRFISSVRGAFLVRTPHTDAGIDGTEAMLAVDGSAVDVLVLVREGIVTATDRRQPGLALALSAGQASYSSNTQALVAATPENVPAKFRDFLVNPEGAADWAVYYPPILLGAGVGDPLVQRAAALLDAGDPRGAETLLNGYS
ncbi:MAG: FecR domain-containing protein, partial [Pseudomonadota bacterium]